MDESILLVEDDVGIREITAHGLTQAGFAITAEADGRQALIRLRNKDFDLVLLDVMLPSLDGIQVCREIRKSSSVPVVMLTAKTETVDVVTGLEAGADDYVTKPFEMPELLARVRAVLRRASAGLEENTIRLGEIEIDGAAFKAFKRGEPLELTATEFRLLYELARHQGQAMTRDLLLELVWEYDYLGDSRVVDMAIKRLRHKIEDDPSDARWIQTVRGVGYRLEA